MARMCSQVSGEAVTEETVRLFRYRDWRKYAQVRSRYDTEHIACIAAYQLCRCLLLFYGICSRLACQLQVYHDRISQLFAGGADILDIKARSELASLVGIKVSKAAAPQRHTQLAVLPAHLAMRMGSMPGWLT